MANKKREHEMSKPGELDDGSKPLNGMYERLARLLALDHRKNWSDKEISEHFGWTLNATRTRMYAPKVLNRAYFLGRRRLRQLAFRAIEEMEDLLVNAESERVRFQVAKDILDRAGMAQAPDGDAAGGSKWSVYFDFSGGAVPKSVVGDIIPHDLEAEDGK